MHQDSLCNDTCSLRYGIAAVVFVLWLHWQSVCKVFQKPPATTRQMQQRTDLHPDIHRSPAVFDRCFFFILLSFCWFLLISSLSLFSFYLFIHLFFPRCVLHGWSTKLAVLTVAAVQFKTTHKYTNAPTLDTYSMLLPETTCNRAKLKLTSEDSGVIHYST